jgi:hypothetical protein
MVVEQRIVTEETGALECVEGKVFGPATGGVQQGLLIIINQKWQFAAEEYDEMEDDEQDVAFRALSLSRLQDDLHDESDYEPEV